MQTLILFSIVASVLLLAAIAIALLVLALRVGGRREDSVDDRDALSTSRFTMPVSIVVPASESTGARETDATIAAALRLTYPELEVIVVAAGLPISVWERLTDAWGLEAREFFYRRSIPTAPIRMMYRSSRDPRLLIVDKTPGSIADALNCGTNLARFAYVTAIEPGMAFDEDALLRVMTPPLRDPAGVVGATSHVEILGTAFQRLRSIRSLMDSRLVWRNLRAALGPRDAVVVWRRDLVDQSGGFSTSAADPQLDLMVRLQTSTVPGLRGQVVRTAEIFGHRHARPLIEHVRLTARRQMAALEAITSLLSAGPNTRLMLAYFVVSEVVTPVVQTWVIVATTIGAAAGWLPWTDAALAVILLAMGHAIVSGAALLLRGAVALAPDAPGLRRMLWLAPLDFVVSGAAAACARTAGLYAFLKSRRSSEGAEQSA